MNLRDLELEPVEGTPHGHSFSATSLTNRVGASKTGLGVYELEPGQASWPYHFELVEEEWVVVLVGEIVVRTRDGEQRLSAGDVAAFQVGPAGAHAIRNDGSTTARYVMLSSAADDGDGAVYPDSGTFVVRTAGFAHRGRLGEQVPYWDGES